VADTSSAVETDVVQGEEEPELTEYTSESEAAVVEARKPAALASASVVKSLTFSGLGGRAAQDGRQYIPVVITPRMNLPSNLPLRASARFQDMGSGNFMGGD